MDSLLLNRKWGTHLEIAMNDSLRVHVVDRFEDLLDQICGVPFGVAALLDDPIKEFAAVNAIGFVGRSNCCALCASNTQRRPGKSWIIISSVLSLAIGFISLPLSRARALFVSVYRRRRRRRRTAI